MHELGVVFHVIDSVKEIAADNGAKHVNGVTLEIGEVSGIIHDYLEDCWKWAVEKQEIMSGCRLTIETIPAVTLCEDCGHQYSTVTYAKICPACGSENTYLIQGNEFVIKEIEVV